jgi:hypothetical protein
VQALAAPLLLQSDPAASRAAGPKSCTQAAAAGGLLLPLLLGEQREPQGQAG